MKVTILSQKDFNALMIIKNITNENVEEYKNDFFISIIEPHGAVSYFEERENVKIMKFYDVEEDIGNFKAFTEAQAKELYEFISKQGDRKNCVVHCAAGVSRSGAVGTFINDYFGGDFNEFKQRNPHILPNGLVLSLLNREARGEEPKEIV